MSASGALIFGATTNVTITLPLRTAPHDQRRCCTTKPEDLRNRPYPRQPQWAVARQASYVAWSSSVDGRGITRQLANSSIRYGKQRLVRIRWFDIEPRAGARWSPAAHCHDDGRCHSTSPCRSASHLRWVLRKTATEPSQMTHDMRRQRPTATSH